jgi:hypothetical protein
MSNTPISTNTKSTDWTYISDHRSTGSIHSNRFTQKKYGDHYMNSPENNNNNTNSNNDNNNNKVIKLEQQQDEEREEESQFPIDPNDSEYILLYKSIYNKSPPLLSSSSNNIGNLELKNKPKKSSVKKTKGNMCKAANKSMIRNINSYLFIL